MSQRTVLVDEVEIVYELDGDPKKDKAFDGVWEKNGEIFTTSVYGRVGNVDAAIVRIVKKYFA